MYSFFTLRRLLPIVSPLRVLFLPQACQLAGLLLVVGLASCSSAPEATAEAPATTAALPVAPASAAATAPAVASPDTLAPAPAPVASKAKPAPARPPAPQPLAVAAPAPVATEEPAAAPVPTTVVAPAAPTTRTQAGRVLDENGRPLIGATVMLRGSTKGTSTDANGNYSLEVPAGENTFVVGYGGYEDDIATTRDAQPLNVTLVPTPGSKAKRRGR